MVFFLSSLQPEITDVILMGGGTRVPKVQENLLEFLKRCVYLPLSTYLYTSMLELFLSLETKFPHAERRFRMYWFDLGFI